MTSSVPIKTPEEIQIMQESGRIARTIIDELIAMANPGTKTIDLDKHAENLISKHKVKAAFKGFEGYKHSIVSCVNEEVVHGIPSNRELIDGDLLTIDFGVIYNGFYSDVAETKLIGESKATTITPFLDTGRQALFAAIDECSPGKRMGDVGNAMQQVVEKNGYNVIRYFVGHGVGKDLHEPPQVPGTGQPNTGILLKEGMVLAVEIMYVQGGFEVEILEDGWTAVTRDRSLSAMFENTVAITPDGPLILTQK